MKVYIKMEKGEVAIMPYRYLQFKSFCIRRNAFAESIKCLFFKNDSYLSNYLSKESVFSQNPETATIPFLEKSTFIFGEWFCG